MGGLLRRLWPWRARARTRPARAPSRAPDPGSPVKLVVGLGNPGPEYASTRHNAGFRVLGWLADELGIELGPSPFPGVACALGSGALRADGDAPAVGVALLAPLGFMNRSGAAVAEALASLRVEDPAADVVVVLDDVDLPFGRLRLRAGGGAGGHRGLADVIERVGRRDLPRLRFGVGRPPGGGDTAAHVLAPFSAEEEAALPGLLERAGRAVEDALRRGVPQAMNRVNRPEPEPTADPTG